MSAIEELRELVFKSNVVLHGSPQLLSEIETMDDGYGNIIVSATIIPEVALYYALFRRLPGRMPNGGSWAFIEKDAKYFMHFRITQERLDYMLSCPKFDGFIYLLNKKDFMPIGYEECRLTRKTDILKKIPVSEIDLPFNFEEGKLEYFILLPYSFPDFLSIKSQQE